MAGRRRQYLLLVVILAAYILFLLWRDLPQAPLSSAEIEAGFAEARRALQAQKDADVHKWAALQKAQVFPVAPFFSLHFVRLLVALVLFGPAAWWVLRRRPA